MLASVKPEPSAAVPAGVRRCWTGGGWRDVPFFDRAVLAPGAAFAGPALVFESHSATLVAGRVAGAGWTARGTWRWSVE